MINVKFKKLHLLAETPKQVHSQDAAFDLVALSKSPYNGNNADLPQYLYEFGLSIELPEDHFGLIVPRSSIYKTTMRLSNCCGILDCGYTGPIMAIFDDIAKSKEYNGLNYSRSIHYNIGDRIAQIIILPRPKVSWECVEELSSSERGTGGFGSSDK